jgi:PadR family transcriptional regulator, regulatory protein PadR
MPTQANDRDALMQGTLDLLILRILSLESHHGQGVARRIQAMSGDTLIVDHGSLYPALQRLEEKGLLRSKWGTSTNNRRARFYELTAAGRRHLAAERGRWERLVESIAMVLGPTTAEG